MHTSEESTRPALNSNSSDQHLNGRYCNQRNISLKARKSNVDFCCQMLSAKKLDKILVSVTSTWRMGLPLRAVTGSSVSSIICFDQPVTSSYFMALYL